MSTILNALKRAEQDCPDQANEKNPSLTFNTRATLNSKMQRRQRESGKRPGQIVVAFSAAGALVVFFFFFWGAGRDFKVTTSADNKMVQSRTDISAEPEKENRVISLEKKLESTNIPGTVHENIPDQPEINAPVGEAFTEPGEERKMTVVENKPQDIDGNIPGTEAADHTKAEDTVPLTSIPVQFAPGAEKESSAGGQIPEIPLLEEGILKIQAISWAADPVDRIVVINNKILCEGESVQDYRVLEIQKNQVLLHHSGQKCKLGFRYR